MSQHENGDVASDLMNQTKQYAQKGGRKMANLLRKKTSKVAKAIGKKAIAVGVQVIGNLVSLLAPILLPILGFILVLIILANFWNILEYDEKSTTQNIQNEGAEHNNTLKDGDDGYKVVDTISKGNVTIQAFYMNYANQSYFKYHNDTNHPNEDNDLIRAGTEYKLDGVHGRVNHGRNDPGTSVTLQDIDVVDKYKNESSFIMSHGFLWMLDEYLHQRDFRYPESFIRPIAMDFDTFQVKSLVADQPSGQQDYNVESVAYDDDGVQQENQTEPGMWDYGLSSVISYQEFEEDAKYIYEPNRKEVWVYEYYLDGVGYGGTSKWVPMESTDTETYPTIESEFTEWLDDYPRTVFLIDKVATHLGTIRPTIKFEWEDTKQQAPTIKEVYQTITVPYRDVKMVNQCIYGDDGTCTIKVKVVDSVGVTHRWETTEKCFQELYYQHPEYILTIKDTCQGKLIHTNKTPTKIWPFTEVEEVTIREETKELLVRYEGYRWELSATYEGNPDISNIVGDEYLRQYLSLYETYVPDDVLHDFDLSKRTTENEEALQAIIDEYNANKAPQNPIGSLVIEDRDESSLQNAYDESHVALFEKYGDMYGVDPNLLAAMAAQESGGQHLKYVNYERCSVAGCGLMQIEKPGITVTQVTAYNFNTNSYDSYTVCPLNVDVAGCLNAYDVEDNIHIGAMQFASRLKEFNYNVLLSIQSYNFGVRGMKTVLEMYGAQVNKTVNEIIFNHQDTGWLDYRANLHFNPCKLGGSYCDYKTYGDALYIEHVLRYFPSNRDITVYRAETNREMVTVSVVGLTGVDELGIGGIGSVFSSVSGFFNKVFNKVVNMFGNLFGDKVDNFEPPTQGHYYEIELTERDVERLVRMIFAMEDEIPVGDVEPVTLDTWKEKFEVMFPNPFGVSWGVVSGMNGSFDEYFSGGASSPLSLQNPTILTPYHSHVDGGLHKGVDVFAPMGTEVKAIFDGKITNVKNEGSHNGWTVSILHDNGVLSIYGNLNESDVQSFTPGQAITKGQKLGSVAQTETNKQAFHFELRKDGNAIDPTFLFNKTGNYSNVVPPEFQGKFIRPTDEGRITCLYEGYSGHAGIDIGKLTSYTPNILAIADGVVYEKGYDAGGFGNYVKVKHFVNGVEYTAIYAHMSVVHVGRDQTVRQGDSLGIMGTTGYSTGIHLHFGLYYGAYISYRGSNLIAYPDMIDWLGADLTSRYCLNGPSPASWQNPY